MSIQIKSVMKGPNEIVSFDHPYIHYPQYASQKYDGFRLLNLCGEHLLSPALKPFPNIRLSSHLRTLFQQCQNERLVTDGEIWSPKLSFNELQSIVRSQNAEIPDHVGYYIFDMLTEEEWNNGTEPMFAKRYTEYRGRLAGHEHIVTVEQRFITDWQEAGRCFDAALDAGQEGIILRSQSAKYKHGRCTLKQDGMWKFKEFATQDGVIIDIEQQMKLKEGVTRTTNAIGHLERRYEQDLYEPASKAGAFVVEMNGQRFKVKPGKGMNDPEKERIWKDFAMYPEKWRGKYIEFKSMTHGAKDKPRIGSLVRFRPDLD